MEFSTQYRIKRCADHVKIQPCDLKDMALFDKLIGTGKEFFQGRFSTLKEHRTYDQLNTVWKLVEVIFQSQEGRKPTKEEKETLYEDLKAEYADKRASTVNPNVLVPVGMSKADTVSAARFIQNLLNVLADMCDLDNELGTSVRAILTEWSNWRGSLEVDPLDNCTESEWYEMHRVSEASGLGGIIDKCHIVSRGADESSIDCPWNWVALTREEHREQHQKGWVFFLNKYPHLKNRVERARKIAGKLERINA